ncbi:MAG: glyceraldehyde-3-phosphate dehydrogenase [Rhodobacter sp. CACIA14H1]|nr:MAG: glyceraldehyde-3-phosphate dehydrogenase [Rhodobacter sp. CACIA14H1]
MTDRIALALAAFVAGLVLLDLVANGGEALLFLMRKLFVFVEFLTFWR